MTDIQIRKIGKCGRITLNRPKALNALSYENCLAIEKALDMWRNDDDVAMIVIDAKGEKAFCAGGDIQVMYDTAVAGDFDYGRRFWHDEYRLNAKISNYPKPYAAFMQGFNMGGGVGVSCHGSHRIVCETSKIAMPETGIGLVPDVGGSLLLARAPGRLGEYLGTTGGRMDAGNAIYAGFADYFIPYEAWESIIQSLEETGDWNIIDYAAQPAPEASLEAQRARIDRLFAGEAHGDILRSLQNEDSSFTAKTLKTLGQKSPLAVACAIEICHRVRAGDSIFSALSEEFKYTWRAAEHGDFIEGIRALIIDKDNTPNWQHGGLAQVSDIDVMKMLLPLGEHALQQEK